MKKSPKSIYQLREFSVSALEVPSTLGSAREDLSNGGEFAQIVAKYLKTPIQKITDIRILRKALDSRKANQPIWKYNIQFTLLGPASLIRNRRAKCVPGEPIPKKRGKALVSLSGRVAVVGAGPAGMFAALGLAKKGHEVHVFEQGPQVKERARDIRLFIKQDMFNPSSNIMYGEGGAGTFSDGKLTCRSQTAWTQEALNILVECGAPKDIAYLARPHVGTDQLQFIVTALKEKAVELGVTFHFKTKVLGLEMKEVQDTSTHLKSIQGIWLETPKEDEEQHALNKTFWECTSLVFAAGHSSRHLYKDLIGYGVEMVPKPFSVGVRVEHPQELINRCQLGNKLDTKQFKQLGSAEYYLTHQDAKEGTEAYSFCMCPGGVVVPCADSPEGICTNGMSYHSRATAYANSAIVVPVTPEDLAPPKVSDNTNQDAATHVLAGVAYQEELEKKAFRKASQLGGKEFTYPAQTIQSFVREKVDTELPRTSFQRPLVPFSFHSLFSAKVAKGLKQAFYNFDRKIPGFIETGLMIGPETRTSSPIRILRDRDTLESTNIQGLYPIGEGAGYSGGIISSAADGLRLADCVVERK
jgi:uncharacterized FAD-dependent dehydrogenase